MEKILERYERHWISKKAQVINHQIICYNQRTKIPAIMRGREKEGLRNKDRKRGKEREREIASAPKKRIEGTEEVRVNRNTGAEVNSKGIGVIPMTEAEKQFLIKTEINPDKDFIDKERVREKREQVRENR